MPPPVPSRGPAACGATEGREVAQAGVLAGADGVLDPGVDPVGGVDVGALAQPAFRPGRPVGDPQGVAPAVHHSDAGSQYTSIRFAQTLLLAGLTGSVGSV